MPSPYDLTTLASLKQYISPATATSTTADSILQQIITGVSKGIAQYLSRTLFCQQWTEIRNGSGRRALRTLVYPILSVQGINISYVAGQPGQVLTSNNYAFDTWFIYLEPGWAFGNSFSQGKQNITLTYTAGFLTPGQIALLSLPAWAPNVSTTVGAQISASGFVYQAITGGTTSSGSSPYFPAQQNAIVHDNSVYWLAIAQVPGVPSNAPLLPEDIQLACNQQAALISKGRTRVGDTSTGVGPDRVSFYLRGMSDSTKEILTRKKEVFPIDGMGVDRLLNGTAASTTPVPAQVFFDAESLTGIQNGINQVFTLPAVPNPPASLELYYNGQMLTQGEGYTLSQATVTMTLAPVSTDQLVAFFRG